MTATSSITQAMPALLRAVDMLDWSGVRAVLDNTVRLDYTSLFGGEVETLSADEVITRWQSLLPGFDATQHLTGPIVVDDYDDTHAHCTTTLRGYHHWVDGEERATWMVAGTYDVHLRFTDGRWAVSAITLHALYQEGEQTLIERATERVAAGAGRTARSPHTVG